LYPREAMFLYIIYYIYNNIKPRNDMFESDYWDEVYTKCSSYTP